MFPIRLGNYYSKLIVVTLTIIFASIPSNSIAQSNYTLCGVFDFHVSGHAQLATPISGGILNTTLVLDNPIYLRDKNNWQAKESDRYLRQVFTGLQPYYKYAALKDVIIATTCRQDGYGRLIYNENGIEVVRFYERVGLGLMGDEEKRLLADIASKLDAYKETIIQADQSFANYSKEVDAAFASVTDRVLNISMDESDKEAIRSFIKQLVQVEMEEIINEEVQRRLNIRGEQ